MSYRALSSSRNDSGHALATTYYHQRQPTNNERSAHSNRKAPWLRAGYTERYAAGLKLLLLGMWNPDHKREQPQNDANKAYDKKRLRIHRFTRLLIEMPCVLGV